MVFITENTNYYYKIMPFGLKNVEATYQRLTNKVFVDQIERIMEVYADNMVAKTIVYSGWRPLQGSERDLCTDEEV